jgi:long-chain acyl-CoA synthetase
MGVNVGQILRQGALRHPQRVALVEWAPGGERRALDYATLDLRARRAAARLQRAGVGPGHGALLSAGNSADFVCAWFGVVYAGGFVVPAPVLSAAPELAHRLSHAGCSVVLCDAPRRELAERAVAQAGREVAVLDVHALCSEGLERAEGAEHVQGDHVPLAEPRDAEAGAPALVLYTSGTTGTPKGAAISHASLLLHTTVIAQHALKLDGDSAVLGVLPLTHSYGCRMVMLASFYAGARAVLVERFDAARTLQLMQDERVSFVPAVPTMYAAWGALPEGAPPSALGWALCAGAPLAEETARRAEARLGVEVRQGFGMTEATFATLNAPPDRRVFGSVGRPAWGVELRITDDEGRERPQGSAGEVWVRGHNVMTHYLHDPAATGEALHDGFLRTGDVGVLDAEGRLSIVDRLKDMIIRGGNNVYPSEVEAVLVAHPQVRDAAVIGRPDAYYGEEVVAVLVAGEGAAPDAQALYAWAEQRLSRTKLPRELCFVAELPLGPSGKVLKRTLREWLRDGRLSPQPVGHK